MKKITNKFFVSLFALTLVVVGAIGLTACAGSDDKTSGNTNENLCTVSYDLNFDDKDYKVLQNCMNGGLSFDIAGFKNESKVIESNGVSIVYSKQQEIGRNFNLYKFADKVLNNYFDGWYTYSGIKIDDLIVADGDITLYAKWNENLSDLVASVDNYEKYIYEFNKTNMTASFKNVTYTLGYYKGTSIRLPELAFNNGKFYTITDVSATQVEDAKYYVPKTYNGSLDYPIIFPNQDRENSSITYLGDYISVEDVSTISIYLANYDNNTLKLVNVIQFYEDTSENLYLKLGKDINLNRIGESERTMKVTNYDWLIGANTCPSFKHFVISKDSNVTLPNLLLGSKNQPDQVYFEITKDEVTNISEYWGEDSALHNYKTTVNIYYYSEAEPASDGYNYWHYVGSTVTVWGK